MWRSICTVSSLLFVCFVCALALSRMVKSLVLTMSLTDSRDIMALRMLESLFVSLMKEKGVSGRVAIFVSSRAGREKETKETARQRDGEERKEKQKQTTKHKTQSITPTQGHKTQETTEGG